MNFNDFYKDMIHFGVFSYEDIRGVFGKIDRRRIYEWNSRGYIRKLVKGQYIFKEFENTAGIEFLISNKLCDPSYVSLEYVMSVEGLIPEAVYTITAITTQKTNSYDTDLGTYSYRNIKRNLFLGYDLKPLSIFLPGHLTDRFVKVATLEKAFYDFIYLKNRILSDDEIYQYRFDHELLSKLNEKKLNKFIEMGNNKSTELNINKILSLYAIDK